MVLTNCRFPRVCRSILPWARILLPGPAPFNCGGFNTIETLDWPSLPETGAVDNRPRGYSHGGKGGSGKNSAEGQNGDCPRNRINYAPGIKRISLHILYSTRQGPLLTVSLSFLRRLNRETHSISLLRQEHIRISSRMTSQLLPLGQHANCPYRAGSGGILLILRQSSLTSVLAPEYGSS